MPLLIYLNLDLACDMLGKELGICEAKSDVVYYYYSLPKYIPKYVESLGCQLSWLHRTLNLFPYFPLYYKMSA